MADIRKLVMENVEDDKAAREILLHLQMLSDKVTEREQALQDQLLEERASATLRNRNG